MLFSSTFAALHAMPLPSHRDMRGREVAPPAERYIRYRQCAPKADGRGLDWGCDTRMYRIGLSAEIDTHLEVLGSLLIGPLTLRDAEYLGLCHEHARPWSLHLLDSARGPVYTFPHAHIPEAFLCTAVVSDQSYHGTPTQIHATTP